MWHWAHVVGSRASSTDAVCREWQAVQVPIEPSAFGRPTAWQLTHPLCTADPPSTATRGLAGLFELPGWNFSAWTACSAVLGYFLLPVSPETAGHEGMAWRVWAKCSFCKGRDCFALGAVKCL